MNGMWDDSISKYAIYYGMLNTGKYNLCLDSNLSNSVTKSLSNIILWHKLKQMNSANSAFIAVVYFRVTVGFSTMSRPHIFKWAMSMKWQTLAVYST
jgi:hypothetical protein